MIDIGVCGIAQAQDPGTAVLAEELGYRDYWVGDNPIMWSDPYVTLALAAERTHEIRLGTGVAVAGTRSPEVTAAGVATVNALAPGRVVCGVGTGNTAMRALGRSPMKVRDFERWLSELRPLLAGEEVTLERDGGHQVVRQLSPEPGLVCFDPPAPLFVSGYGPKAIALAGAYGDGLIGIGTHPSDVRRAWTLLHTAADAVGRTLDPARFFTAIMTTMAVLAPGELRDSHRVKEEVGPYAITVLHQAYEEARLLHREPPAFVHDVWDEYVALVDAVDKERRHMRIHAGHAFRVLEEERRFITAALMDAVAMIGTPEELADRLGALAAEGLDEVVIVPPPAVKRKVLRHIADEVMPLLLG